MYIDSQLRKGIRQPWCTFTNLDLTGWYISEELAKKLLPILKLFSTHGILVQVFFDNCSFEKRNLFPQIILSLAQPESSLKVFSAYDHKLDDKGFAALEFLLETITLNQLCIAREYRQTDTLGPRVAKLILTNQNLENLDASGYDFGRLDCPEGFSSNISRLRISHSCFAPNNTGCVTFFNSFMACMPRLKHLSLSRINLSREQMRVFLGLIESRVFQLTHLRLDHTQLANAEMAMFFRIVGSDDSSLQFLDISGNNFTYSQRKIEEFLRTKCRLQGLRIGLSRPLNCHPILSSLMENRTITHFYLDLHQITPKFVQKLNKLIMNNSRIRHIWVDYHASGEDFSQIATDAIRNSTTLVTLKIKGIGRVFDPCAEQPVIDPALKRQVAYQIIQAARMLCFWSRPDIVTQNNQCLPVEVHQLIYKWVDDRRLFLDSERLRIAGISHKYFETRESFLEACNCYDKEQDDENSRWIQMQSWWGFGN